MPTNVRRSRHPYLVVAVLRDVPDPRQRLVTAALVDAQVLHRYPRDGEVGDLELHLHGTLRERLAVVVGDRGQPAARVERELLLALELLDAPHNHVAIRQVLGRADGGLERRALHVRRHRNVELHVLGDGLGLELRNRADREVDARGGLVVHQDVAREERLDVTVDAICHELELAVRRDEGDGPVRLEALQLDALVELYVLHVDGFHVVGAAGGDAAGGGSATRRRHLEHRLVVHAQKHLRHAREVGLHFEAAADLRAEHRSRHGDHDVQALHHVEEYLVLLVLDPLPAPRDGVGHGRGRPDGVGGQLVEAVANALPEDADFRGLRVAVVEHLVEQLVYDDEVLADALLPQGLEVALQDLDEAVEEGEHHGDVVVGRGRGQEVHVVVQHPAEGASVAVVHRPDRVRLLEEHFGVKGLADVGQHVVPVRAADHHLPLAVEDVYPADASHFLSVRRFRVCP
ncbi:cob(I)yrinic acid a,c-diamide adenosyltransferase [Babesia caballi]|uniref:Cob(I)yrinic acid a,c-diamide adenosyltransferase n=1 Tax=Babesia caballi TaxID=5871 RepID=A0AAV4LRQ4_BABCB|nr:cob(I)yrinic acid a,c-diamide adenosyltransferase [Babesia caballi]